MMANARSAAAAADVDTGPAPAKPAAPGAPGAPPLLSDRWFRFAALRPTLAAQLRVQRISYRREPWMVLEHADTGRSFRINAAAYAFVGRCNGQRTMQTLWDLLLAERRDAAPTQDELLRLLWQLHGAGLLGFDRRVQFGPAGSVPAEPLPGKARRGNSLLAIRMPLGRPEALLDRIGPRLEWLATPAALALWAVGVGGAALAALLHAATLGAQWQHWSNTPRMLALAWIAYPSVKALHELGHALALRHFGARVPQWGVTLMLFTPVPYVDASAAASLPAARQRVLVGAAGIMVELALASLGLAVALTAQPGIVHDFGLAVFFVGAVSTLLVNGNPLLRFDGYHVLVDALQLPNLAPRSARWWSERLRAGVLGAPDAAAALRPARGETAWLWAYAPASLAYRVVVCLALVGWAAKLSLLLGLGLGAVFVWMLLGRPLLGLLRWLRGDALADAQRGRARRRVIAIGLGIGLLGGAVPLPFASVVQGVVWLPDEALVRAGSAGVIEAVQVADGQPVAAGDVLFTLESPTLATERSVLASRLDALEVGYHEALHAGGTQAANLALERDAGRAELARLDQRLDDLTVRAGAAGRVALTHPADLPGRHVAQGTLLAHVLGDGGVRVRVAIPHEQVALIGVGMRSAETQSAGPQAAEPPSAADDESANRRVSVRLADDRGASWPATLLPGAATAVAQLPSAALGDRSGGAIVTDPQDARGLMPAAAVMLADVRLDGPAATAAGGRVGGRAWVRFEHGHAPLAWQAARRVQQLFLQHFNPAQ